MRKVFRMCIFQSVKVLEIKFCASAHLHSAYTRNHQDPELLLVWETSVVYRVLVYKGNKKSHILTYPSYFKLLDFFIISIY